MESDRISELEKRQKILLAQIKLESKEVLKIKQTIDEVHHRKQRSISQIQFVSQVVLDRVRGQEEKLIEKVEEATEAQIKQLEWDIEESQKRTADCKKQIASIHQGLNCGDVSETYKTIRQSDIPVFTRHRHVENIEFLHDLDKVNRTLVSVHLGEVKVTKQTTEKAESPTSVFVGTIEAKTKKDIFKPNLLDLTVLVINGQKVIVMVDLDNRCIKSFSLKEKKIVLLDKLIMKNYPFGLTKINDEQIMVTVPISKLIQTIELKPEFSEISVMKTRRKYYSLAFIKPSTLAAGCCYPVPSVDFLDLQGHILHSVQLFDKPIYMCESNKQILVSDWKKRSITCLSKEGCVLWHYKPSGCSALRCVYGITSTTKGEMMIADRDACKVILLNQQREVVRDVLTALDDIHEPQGICLDESKGYLYVCDRSIVRIFKMAPDISYAIDSS